MISKRQLKEGKAYLFKYGTGILKGTYVRVITIDGDRVNFTLNDDNRFIWSEELSSFRKKVIRELSDKVDYRSEQEK